MQVEQVEQVVAAVAVDSVQATRRVEAEALVRNEAF
jgi:hypothetical protein